jgi:uncharacterized protein
LRVHVSIHDVAPPHRREVELALDLARAKGVKPALLVVPDFHDGSPLRRDPSLCARLRELQKDGHEIFLHGFSHRAAPSVRAARGLSHWLFQRLASDGEAEMHGLTPDEMLARIDAGERALEEAGLEIDGFVPPAWRLPRCLLPILAARGYTYSEDHVRIYSPAEDRSSASLVLNYASRTTPRLYSSIAFCRAAAPLSALVPARIAIHPTDMRHALLRREVARLLSWDARRFVSRASELFA